MVYTLILLKYFEYTHGNPSIILKLFIKNYQSKLSMNQQLTMNYIKSFIKYQFVNAFIQKYSYSPIQALQVIKNAKKTKKSSNVLTYISKLQSQIDHICRILQIQSINISNLSSQVTPTDVNKVITKLLIKNTESRQKIESMRIECISKLKTKKLISQEHFNILFGIYKLIYSGKQNIEYKNINNEKESKHFRTVLISLKKMIVIEKQKVPYRRIIKNNLDPYHLNIQIKNALLLCESKFYQQGYKQISVKLKFIRMNEKKKWIGPRLWQILKSNNWKNYQIELLIQLFQQSVGSMIMNKEYKSSEKALEKISKKIISNLRGLISINQDSTYLKICKQQIENSVVEKNLNDFYTDLVPHLQKEQKDILNYINNSINNHSFIKLEEMEEYQRKLMTKNIQYDSKEINQQEQVWF